MNVTVMFAGKKHDLHCTEDSLKCLSELIAKEINVPVSHQKIIFKGKSLQSGSLSEQGLCNRAKVMLIGSKEEIIHKEEFTVLDNVEKDLGNMEVKLAEINEELDGFNKGFVPDDLKAEFVKSLSKKCMTLNDRGEKNLLKLDGLTLRQDSEKARSKRKSLIDRLQSLLTQSDSALSNLLQLASDAGLDTD